MILTITSKDIINIWLDLPLEDKIALYKAGKIKGLETIGFRFLFPEQTDPRNPWLRYEQFKREIEQSHPPDYEAAISDYCRTHNC